MTCAALSPGEDGPVVSEEGSGQSERIRSCLEDVGDVVTLDGAKAGGGEGDSRAVVEEVQDLDRTAVGQMPGGGVDLPGFVGQLGGKADEGRLRPFLGLRCDEAVTFEDPPDGRHRGRLADLLGEVVVDGVRAGVMACGRQLAAQLDLTGPRKRVHPL